MASILSRKRVEIPPSWCLVLFLGFVFFWLNSGAPGERHDKLWHMRVWSYANKYCDLSAVLAWMDLDHQGIDPRFQCPVCPCGPSPMNYGAAVLWLGRLGLYRITTSGVDWLGPVVAVLFLSALASILTDAAIWHTLYLALLLFSPPVFLALERGNLDLIIFVLLVLAVVLECRFGNAWSYSLVFAAGALKYYPFAAAIAFLRPTRRGWACFAALAGAIAGFAFLTRGYIATARPPEVGRFGWGYPAMFKLLPELLNAHGVVVESSTRWQMRLTMLLSGTLIVIVGWIWRAPLQAFLGPRRQPRMLFLVGATLYAGCFAVSSNFEYRNIFLLLMLPQLLWRFEEKGYFRHIASSGLILVLVVFTLSWFHTNDWSVIAQQGSYWLLFCFCGILSFIAVCPAPARTAASTVPTQVAESGTVVQREITIGATTGPGGRIHSRHPNRRIVIGCLLLASGLTLYWITSRFSEKPVTGSLIDHPDFTDLTPAGTPWTLGTAAPSSCAPAIWHDTLGYPGGAVVLNSCGEKTSNPFAAQRVRNLIPGTTYVLTFDWAQDSATSVYGAGTGRSFAVFVDLSGSPPSPWNDMADTVPVFIGERLDYDFESSPPITFVATGTSATIYFEAELDPRTPGGPPKATDVAYIIDNIDLRVKPPDRH